MACIQLHLSIARLVIKFWLQIFNTVFKLFRMFGYCVTAGLTKRTTNDRFLVDVNE